MDNIPSTWTLQPTSRMCFVCGRENPVGLHLTFYEDREQQQVICPFSLPESYQGYPGIAHGGILASVLDEVSGRAVMIGEDKDVFWVTAKLEVKYRKPTPTETPLTAVGWTIRRRRHSAEVAGEIRLPDGTVTAEVHAIVVIPAPETLREWEAEQAYWRVEPPSKG